MSKTSKNVAKSASKTEGQKAVARRQAASKGGAAKSAKSKSAKKASKPAAKKGNGEARTMNALQEKLLKLFRRPNGATLEDTSAAGANRPALMALRMFEGRGYKTSVVKKAGEPTRYFAK